MAISDSSCPVHRQASFCAISIAIAFLFVVCFSCLPLTHSLPFILLHGLGNECDKEGMSMMTELLSNHSGQEGFCIEVGNGIKDSWFKSMTTQVDSVCETVKSMSALESGYNIVALSQGGLIARAVIQWCEDGPPVNNLISLGSPHAGTASVPYCGNLFLEEDMESNTLSSEDAESKVMCSLANYLIELGVYTSYVQNHLGPAGYVKIPTDLKAYYKGCKFLPYLNNELEDSRNTTYVERFTSLNQLILVKFESDNVLLPRETAWFGYYTAGSLSSVLAYNETDLYIEDWIGLRALDEAGKVNFLSLPRGHLQINETEMSSHIVPYLIDTSALL
ncbi:hypothetical protein KP509_07G084500 [Ceratopteris richardii]|uniref:Palmitoyl-protein thioesterase 1 n=1 Tax=Ceratopteris richardii TaxID=49495 RepID=A0A8T2UIS8_CERRI|nr:hypothetical protein KP509_07G084500 [Ceratopteris richardii]